MRFNPQKINARAAMMSIVLLAAGGHAGAQQAPPPGPSMGAHEERDVIFFNAAAAGPAGPMVQGLPAAGAALNGDFLFVSAGGFSPGTPVAGAPYSAEASTEIIQTLADGNRIVRRTSSAVARDSQGRTRRDQTLGAVGPWVAPSGSVPQLSFITDPVAGVQYILNHDQRTAHKIPLPPGGGGMAGFGMGSLGTAGAISAAPGMPVPPPGGPPVEWKEHFDMEVTGPQGAAGTRIVTRRLAGPNEAASRNAQTESLGRQSIDGVEAEGTRTTVTIPAGTLGNEWPIHIVSERWFAPSLQVVVWSTHSDPRMGTTTYRLSGINRSEPDRSLFEVPAGYTLTEPPAFSAEGFAECAAAGHPITESFPRSCRTADGKTYVEPPAPGSSPRPFTTPLLRP